MVSFFRKTLKEQLFHSGLFKKEYESFNFISYLCSELYKIEQNKL